MTTPATTFNLFEKLDQEKFQSIEKNAEIVKLYENLRNDNCDEITFRDAGDERIKLEVTKKKFQWRIGYKSHTAFTKNTPSAHIIENIFDAEKTGLPQTCIDKILMYFGYLLCYSASINNKTDVLTEYLKEKIREIHSDIMSALNSAVLTNTMQSENLRRYIPILLSVELVHTEIIEQKGAIEILRDSTLNVDVEFLNPNFYSKKETVDKIFKKSGLLDQFASLDFNLLMELLQNLSSPDMTKIKWLSETAKSTENASDIFLNKSQGKLTAIVRNDSSTDRKFINLSSELTGSDYYNSISEGEQLSTQETRVVLDILVKQGHTPPHMLNAITQERLFMILAKLSTENLETLQTQVHQLMALMRITPFKITFKGETRLHNTHLLQDEDACATPEAFYKKYIETLPIQTRNIFIKHLGKEIIRSTDENTNELLSFFSEDPTLFEKLKEEGNYRLGNAVIKSYSGWRVPLIAVREEPNPVTHEISTKTFGDIKTISSTEESDVRKVQWHIGARRPEYTENPNSCFSFFDSFITGSLNNQENNQLKPLREKLKTMSYNLYTYWYSVVAAGTEGSSTLLEKRQAMIQSMTTFMRELTEQVKRSNLTPMQAIKLILAEMVVKGNDEKIYYHNQLNIASWMTVDSKLFLEFRGLVAEIIRKEENIKNFSSCLSSELFKIVMEGRKTRRFLEEDVSILQSASLEKDEKTYFKMLKHLALECSRIPLGTLRLRPPSEGSDYYLYCIHRKELLRDSSLTPENVYQRIRSLPLEERKVFLAAMFFKDATDDKQQRDATIQFFVDHSREDYILLLAAEFNIVSRALALDAAGNPQKLTNRLLEKAVPSDIAELFDDDKEMTPEDEQEILTKIQTWWGSYKYEIQATISKLPIEEKIICYRIILSDGSPLNRLMKTKRFQLLPDFGLFSTVERIRKDENKTQKFLAILFFDSNYENLKHKVCEQLVIALKNFIIQSRNKEKFIKDYAELLPEKERMSFFFRILWEEKKGEKIYYRPVGLLFREPRSFASVSIERGLQKEISDEYEALKQKLSENTEGNKSNIAVDAVEDQPPQTEQNKGQAGQITFGFTKNNKKSNKNSKKPADNVTSNDNSEEKLCTIS